MRRAKMQLDENLGCGVVRQGIFLRLQQESSTEIFPDPSSESVSPPGGGREKNRGDFFDVTDAGLTKIGDCRARVPAHMRLTCGGIAHDRQLRVAEKRGRARETG